MGILSCWRSKKTHNKQLTAAADSILSVIRALEGDESKGRGPGRCFEIDIPDPANKKNLKKHFVLCENNYAKRYALTRQAEEAICRLCWV
jgi:hypothetical protein